MNGLNRTDLEESIAVMVKRLLSKDFGRLTIEKHQNNVYAEETDKHKAIIATK